MGDLPQFDIPAAIRHNNSHSAREIDSNRESVLVATYQHANDLTVDGQFGPITARHVDAEYARQVELAKPKAPPKTATAEAWPRFDNPLITHRPRSRSEIIKIFGDPGRKRETADPAWVRENIVELHGNDRIPEIPERLYFKCHRLLEPTFREAHRRAGIVCPDYKITSAACFVFRHMRHNPELDLSLHSWAIAEDINPDDNAARYFGYDEDGPEPWTAEWNRLWPRGLPQAFVEAFESVGFRWGGRWRAPAGKKGFRDPMHFEFVGAAEFAA
jgi:hypothetical protein